MDERSPEKKEKLLAALDQGTATVQLDARRPGVLVPAHLRAEPQLVLNLSYRFDPPDLAVGEWGVRSTLSFQGTRFTVAVPWSALYAISSHATKEFWMYPDDMPRELLDQPRAPAAVRAVGGPVPRAKGGLREVSAPAEPGSPRPGTDGGPSQPSRRGHLRVVK